MKNPLVNFKINVILIQKLETFFRNIKKFFSHNWKKSNNSQKVNDLKLHQLVRNKRINENDKISELII